MKLTALQIKQIEDKSRLMTMRHAAESMGLTLNQIDHACRKHGISFKKTGERHHSAKVSDEDIELIASCMMRESELLKSRKSLK